MPNKPLLCVTCAATVALGLPTAASAVFAHAVTRGESLYSIAAADGLSVAQLAAANGLSSATPLMTGATLMIPPRGAVSSPVAAAAPTAVGSSVGGGSAAASGAGSPGAGYVVQPGDTLSAIAARSGTTVAQLAAANGLAPNGILPAGRALRVVSGGSSTTVPVSTTTGSAAGQPVGVAAQGVGSAPPYPTPERVTASEIGQIASANGVSPSLAAAIGWQESGFNNDLVSSADARGVMQITPGTWDWIQNTLTAGYPLAPASAASNVRGGTLLLHWLLSSTGGDPALAAAGYYQGLSSVKARGMYDDTKNYVNSVLALRAKFGG